MTADSGTSQQTVIVQQEGKDLGEFTETGQIKLDLTIEPLEINPLNEKPQSTITITVKRGDAPAKDSEIEVSTSTELGKADTDGHVHDDGKRPKAELEAGGKKGNPLVVKTGDDGKVKLTYSPPKFNKIIIAGKDKITALSKKDSSVKAEGDITTNVPNLQRMSGSENGSGGEGYTFQKQGKHEYLFYGTKETNEALVRIAKAFWDKQKGCKDKPDGDDCKIKDDSGKQITVKITGDQKKMAITAMSLPWGGLCDIDGTWQSPHKTHNDGKVADIGWGVFKTGDSYDKDGILLLRYVISEESNFSSFVSDEGGNYDLTLKETYPHFHVYFKK